MSSNQLRCCLPTAGDQPLLEPLWSVYGRNVTSELFQYAEQVRKLGTAMVGVLVDIDQYRTGSRKTVIGAELIDQ